MTDTEDCADQRADLSVALPSRRRRALTIGVSGAQPVAAGSASEPLPFAAELVPDLAATLHNLGFETVAVAEDTLTTEALGARITAELESAGPEDLLLVHVISHGHAADGDATVYVLGSDGSPHQKTDVAHWLTKLAESAWPPADVVPARFVLRRNRCSAALAEQCRPPTDPGLGDRSVSKPASGLRRALY
jgi:hypothetical protein